MKLNLLPYLIAGACIAQDVVANPLRLIVVTAVPQLQKERTPCHPKLSDSFRKWLGITGTLKPTIPLLPAVPAKALAHPAALEGHYHPESFKHPDGLGEVRVLPVENHEDHEDHHDEDHHGRHRKHGKHGKPARKFWARVHKSLMALGPWEGRAVAFVLGCGIGVLLRMAFVLLVLTFRMVRGGVERPSAPPGYEECAREEGVCVEVVRKVEREEELDVKA